MGPVRRTISFIFALTLAVVGCGGFVYMLFFAPVVRGLVLVAAASVGSLGLYWLWADFINAEPRPDA
jgi:hypothetical protein